MALRGEWRDVSTTPDAVVWIMLSGHLKVSTVHVVAVIALDSKGCAMLECRMMVDASADRMTLDPYSTHRIGLILLRHRPHTGAEEQARWCW